VFDPTPEITLKESISTRKILLSSLLKTSLDRDRKSRIHNTTREKGGRRRSPRFGVFELIFGGSKVFGFAPNLVSLFYT